MDAVHPPSCTTTVSHASALRYESGLPACLRPGRSCERCLLAEAPCVAGFQARSAGGDFGFFFFWLLAWTRTGRACACEVGRSFGACLDGWVAAWRFGGAFDAREGWCGCVISCNQADTLLASHPNTQATGQHFQVMALWDALVL